jgi:hypothetical protein
MRRTPKGIPQHPDELLSHDSAAPSQPRESFISDAIGAQRDLHEYHEKCSREPQKCHDFPRDAYERADKLPRHTHENGASTFDADKDFGR